MVPKIGIMFKWNTNSRDRIYSCLNSEAVFTLVAA